MRKECNKMSQTPVLHEGDKSIESFQGVKTYSNAINIAALNVVAALKRGGPIEEPMKVLSKAIKDDTDVLNALFEEDMNRARKRH
jgi:rRNA processing protein Krr1/Pno1